MPQSSKSGGLLVTGSSGFIGSHVVEQVAGQTAEYVDRIPPASGGPERLTVLDIAGLPALSARYSQRGGRILHLAAEAEVVTPWGEVGDVLHSNVVGTYNLLAALEPELMVFASTSAVYGNGTVAETAPTLAAARPLGLYGASKALCEVVIRDWTWSQKATAVVFRLGNVVGARCRGLIPYLVKHALRYPDGSVPARMRGFGQLIRDYVPVEYVVGLFLEAAHREWTPGEFLLFNAGTGRGTSNREVAEIVAGVLERHSMRLRVAWEDPVAPGEAQSVVLDVEETARNFSLPVPSEAEVRDSIEESVRVCLEAHR